MEPVLQDLWLTLRRLSARDRAFGAQKLLERLVDEGRISASQAHDAYCELRSLNAAIR